jgi:hypothetical protein
MKLQHFCCSFINPSRRVGKGRVGDRQRQLLGNRFLRLYFFNVTAITPGLQTHECLLRICLQAGQPVSDGVPQDIEVDTG